MTAEELKTYVGQNVRNRRRELGMSQEVLAAAVGISQSQIANIELGKSSPSIEVLVKLAEGLRTEPHVFFAPKTFSAVGT